MEGALFLAEQLRKAGLDAHLERLDEDKANVWAILEGQTDEAIVLHNHIDVYSAGEPEEWDFPRGGAAQALAKQRLADQHSSEDVRQSIHRRRVYSHSIVAGGLLEMS